jgi:DNA-binding MarR family transcriptional regulator
MPTRDDFGWRDRAIALASLGATTLSRLAFSPADAIDPEPLEMQVLVALALQDSLAADSPHRTGTHWLSLALRLEQPVVEELVRSLDRANLVRRSSDVEDVGEIEYEFADESDEVVAGELPVVVTELGFQTVDRWVSRTRLHFGSWPPERSDVDDAVG